MVVDYVDFNNSEEVWFWYCSCMTTRADGLRSKSDYCGESRRCEVSDIHMIVKKMHMRQDISNRHLRVMYAFGEMHTPPYYDKRAKNSHIRLWEEGMRVFERHLIEKKIIKSKYTGGYDEY